MSQVVQAHPSETGALADAIPGVVDVALMRAPFLARKHPWVAGFAGQVLQHLRRRWRQRHHAGPGLRIAQAKLAHLEVHVLPAQTENLVSSAPGQHQQPNGRGVGATGIFRCRSSTQRSRDAWSDTSTTSE